MGSFRERVISARKIFGRPWVRLALTIWAFIAFYDTLVSQFFPEALAKKAPKIRELIAETSGWLPWWSWLIIFTAIIAVASFEYAVRKTSSHHHVERQAATEFIWKSAPDAIDAFAEGGLIAARDKWIETFQEAYTKGHEAEDQIREIQKQHGANPANDTDEGRLLDLNRRRLEACTMQSDIAKDELKRAWNDLRDDLQKKMLDGLLVARGFREPHVAGGTEVEIPSSEWRILVLDNVNSEALRKGSGAVIYSGVAFGKRT
jgi:hypothetical protein